MHAEFTLLFFDRRHEKRRFFCTTYIVDAINNWVATTVTHCQDMTCHPKVVDPFKSNDAKHNKTNLYFEIKVKREHVLRNFWSQICLLNFAFTINKEKKFIRMLNNQRVLK